MAKPAGFAAMVSLRTPVGRGNGLPLKGAKRPAYSMAGVKTLPSKKSK